MERRLYRSRTDRVLWGVCGGLANYFGIDPTIVRVVFVLLVLANGIGLLAYIILAIVVPLEGSRTTTPRETVKENVADMKESAAELGRDIRSSVGDGKTEETVVRHNRRNILGIVLIVIGVIFLLGSFNLFWWLHWGNFWPLILIAIGVLIIWGRRRS